MRKFFNKELDEIAISYNPVKVSADLFVKGLTEAIPCFLANMKSLKINDKEQWPEEWMETLLSWLEYNTKAEEIV